MKLLGVLNLVVSCLVTFSLNQGFAQQEGVVPVGAGGIGHIMRASNTENSMRCRVARKLKGDVNNCSVAREWPGQTVNKDGVKMPHVYLEHYQIACEDTCGNKYTVIGQVGWDCAQQQNLASVSVDSQTFQLDSADAKTCGGGNDLYTSSIGKLDEFIGYNPHARDTGMYKRKPQLPAPSNQVPYWGT